MKYCLFFLTIIFLSTTGACQSDAISVSPNGMYACVTIDKSRNSDHPIMVIQATKGAWKKIIPGDASFAFSHDSRYLVFKKQDSLIYLKLGEDKLTVVKNVKSWREKYITDDNWIAFCLNGSDRKLVFKNLNNDKEIYFSSVIDFYSDAKRTMFLIQQQQANRQIVLNLFNVITRELTFLWTGEGGVEDFDFNQSCSSLVFTINNQNKPERSIWFYQKGEVRARMMFSSQVGIEDEEFCPAKTMRGNSESVDQSYKSILLSPAGQQILFYQFEKTYKHELRPSEAYWKGMEFEPAGTPKVDVWSYLDSRLMPDALQVGAIRKRSLYSINTSTGKLSRLELDEKEFVSGGYQSMPMSTQVNDDYALILRFPNNFYHVNYGADPNNRSYFSYALSEFDWNKSLSFDIFLYSFRDGSRRLIQSKIKPENDAMPPCFFSPDLKYIVWYNNKSYHSYQISTGTQKNISRKTNTLLIRGSSGKNGGGHKFYFQNNLFAWIEDKGQFFLLTSDLNHDLWQIAVDGMSSPVNLTNSYSKKKGLRFEIKFDKVFYRPGDIIVVKSNVQSFVYQGYYKVVIGNVRDPQPLIKVGAPYLYSKVVRAQNADTYVLKRHNLKEPSEYLVTTDFKEFLSIVTPQEEQRVMMNKELLSWKSFDGKVLQGVLFKPENFDSTRRYPIMIDFYDWESARGSFYNEDWYNENNKTGHYAIDTGYLLFKPAIEYKTGETGPNAYNCVVSGAEYLTKKSYVNGKKMGIFGTSFSGFEVYYIVTHCSLFAAAFAGCGVTDMVGDYLAFPSGARNTAESTVKGQANLGVTPWQRPDIYLKNSPVFYADRVTTPLLMSHNPNDLNVPFQHGVSMFKALRRLGKPSWLLVGDQHHASLDDATFPYFNEFFNHYLKGAPAAKWMLYPIPAREQGMAKWLTLDLSGRTPVNGGLLFERPIVDPEEAVLLSNKTILNDQGKIVVVGQTKKNQPK